MAEQETLTERTVFNPLDHGLWARYRSGNQIDHAAWMRACADGSWVGTCRRCGDYLLPLRPYQINAKRTDYEAHCRREVVVRLIDGVRTVEGCGWILNAPSGRALTYSSRASERSKDQ